MEFSATGLDVAERPDSLMEIMRIDARTCGLVEKTWVEIKSSGLAPGAPKPPQVGNEAGVMHDCAGTETLDERADCPSDNEGRPL